MLTISGPTTDIRQCLIYDAATPGARLIGIEYMITPRVYATLPAAERSLWHSHVFEVKSGMLIMPKPPSAVLMPDAVWDAAETKEMEQVIGLYGKTYHLWQVDRGDFVPMGEPELMMSFTKEEQLKEKGKEIVEDRDERYRIDKNTKVQKRAYIEEPNVHRGTCSVNSSRWWTIEANTPVDADMMWKDKSTVEAGT